VIAFGFARPHEPSIYPVDGSPPAPVKGLEPGETPVRWCSDGRSIIVASENKFVIHVSRMELATGRREPLADLKPADPVGLMDIGGGAVTPDGKSYVYNDRRTLSDLYLVGGIR